MLQIGDIQLHLINDATIQVDGGGAFGVVPRVLWRAYFTPDEDNLIPMTTTCLLARVDGRNIVVDTGMGDKLDAKARAMWRLERSNGGLTDGLLRLAVAPADIDLVICTHLHADHAGGNTCFGASGNILPTFPNAEYVVQRREYEDAMRPNERTRATYLPINYQPLVASGQMRLLDGDTDLAPGVRGVVTRGHTPGHMSVLFESGGQNAMFVCDMASYAVHMERLGWMTAYDVEPLETLETKRRWQRWALENGALLIFPHDPTRPAGRLSEYEPGKVRLVPVEEPYA